MTPTHGTMTFMQNLETVRRCLTGNQDTELIYVDPGTALEALAAMLAEYNALLKTHG